MTDVVLLLTTISDEAAAEDLARRLVEEHLAACVHVAPAGVSIYRWKGTVERDAERQLIVKTTRDRLAAVRRRIAELHTYELPELLVVDIAGGSEAYLQWIRDSLQAS
jgi:periplasmic divalent cation tolerance protein